LGLGNAPFSHDPPRQCNACGETGKRFYDEPGAKR
jgi:hypothetical protein